MIRLARLSTLTLLLGTVGSALGGCQAIAGIEDRTYVPDGGDEAGAAGSKPDTTASPQCLEYCNKADSVCRTAPSGDAESTGYLYLTHEACLATCAHMPLTGADQNSVACRVQQLGLAVDTGESPELYCANAGPGGNDACGSNCENYCHLFAAACKDEFKKYAANAEEGDDGTAVCISKCLGLADTGLYDATAGGNYTGDTLQCRLVHTTSSMLDPGTHCAHAELKSTLKCVDDPKAEPDCKKFCHLEITECTGFGHPMYESEAQCLAVCGALEPGQIGDQSENTVGCRMYHSYNSLLDPANHCTHTSPGGDGHCVDGKDPDAGNCQSYCRLLENACKADFDSNFADQPACLDECMKLDGAAANSGYSTSASGDNVQCRLLHVSRALSSPKECAAAQGAAPCN